MRKQPLATVLSLGMLVQFSSANASQTTKVTTKVKVSTNFKFMSDLVKSLKIDGVVCTNYKKNTSGVLGVREEGNCTFNRKDLTIDLFPDSKSALAIINRLQEFKSLRLRS